MTHLAYVDCRNLFIEGRKVSAAARGMAHSLEDARQRGVIDFGYQRNFYQLTAIPVRAEGLTRAALFGSATRTAMRAACAQGRLPGGRGGAPSHTGGTATTFNAAAYVPSVRQLVLRLA